MAAGLAPNDAGLWPNGDAPGLTILAPTGRACVCGPIACPSEAVFLCWYLCWKLSSTTGTLSPCRGAVCGEAMSGGSTNDDRIVSVISITSNTEQARHLRLRLPWDPRRSRVGTPLHKISRRPSSREGRLARAPCSTQPQCVSAAPWLRLSLHFSPTRVSTRALLVSRCRWKMSPFETSIGAMRGLINENEDN